MTPLLIIMLIVMVMLLGILAWLMLKEKLFEPDDFNYIIVENYMPQYSGGFSEALLVDFKRGPIRNRYTLAVRDINYLRRLKKNSKIEIPLFNVYAYSWQIIPIEETVLSGERNKMKILPPTPEDLGPEFRDSTFGIALANEITRRKATENVIEVQRKEKDLEDEMLHRTKGRDRIREYLLLDKSLNKEILKKAIDGKDEKKNTFGIGSSGYGQTGAP